MEITNAIRYPCGLMIERSFKTRGIFEIFKIGSVEADPIDPGVCPIHGKSCPPPVILKNPYGKSV